MDERLAGYLQVVGLAGHKGHGARLVAGQFHDVVLAGETAYRFPRDELSRRRLPGTVRLLEALSRTGVPVPVPVAAGHLDAPLGRCHVALTRLPWLWLPGFSVPARSDRHQRRALEAFAMRGGSA
jgi:hypothetical protein